MHRNKAFLVLSMSPPENAKSFFRHIVGCVHEDVFFKEIFLSEFFGKFSMIFCF